MSAELSDEQWDQIAAAGPLTPERLSALSANWSPESRAAMVKYLRADKQRKLIRERYADVCDLALAVDPNFAATPALRLIGRKIETVLRKPRRNLLITMSPQEGKSTLAAVYTPCRALQLNPNTKTILATYAESLALDHSRAARDIVMRHGSGVIDSMTGVEVEDKLGFQIAANNSKVDSWRVANGRGGLVAAGLHGSITGKSADLFIIDDPYKDMAEADSDTQRENVAEWMRSVARTRLSTDASIILIQTRWHPEDLAGEIIAKEKLLDPKFRTWHHVNIPAISEEGIADALGREPGVALESALGRTREDFEATHRDVGDRVWYALYQGSPRNPSGGLFHRTWFEPHAEEDPEHPVAAIVGIDPADTGKNDETGIIGGYLCQDGKVLLAEDWSGMYTPDKWSRQAVLLALQIGAREIAMEAYTAANAYVDAIKNAWGDVRREAIKKKLAGAELTVVEQRACVPDMPFIIHKWRGAAKADAVARSALLRQALETDKCRTVAHRLVIFENQACDWQAGQHQPDRVAAAVITHVRLASIGRAKAQTVIATPMLGKSSTPAPEWMRRRLG